MIENVVMENRRLEQLFLAIDKNITSMENAQYYYEIATIFFGEKKYYDAINYFNQAIKNFYRLDVENECVAECYYYVGECCFNLTKYQECGAYYSKAMEISLDLSNYYMVGKCMQMLGRTYHKNHKIDVAISYFLDAKSIALKIKDYPLLADVLLDMALVYYPKDRAKSTHYLMLAKVNYVKLCNKQKVVLCNNYLKNLA